MAGWAAKRRLLTNPRLSSWRSSCRTTGALNRIFQAERDHGLRRKIRRRAADRGPSVLSKAGLRLRLKSSRTCTAAFIYRGEFDSGAAAAKEVEYRLPRDNVSP
jgi:hypothetical protein